MASAVYGKTPVSVRPGSRKVSRSVTGAAAAAPRRSQLGCVAGLQASRPQGRVTALRVPPHHGHVVAADGYERHGPRRVRCSPPPRRRGTDGPRPGCPDPRSPVPRSRLRRGRHVGDLPAGAVEFVRECDRSLGQHLAGGSAGQYRRGCVEGQRRWAVRSGRVAPAGGCAQRDQQARGGTRAAVA
jgi:hypothetical protein